MDSKRIRRVLLGVVLLFLLVRLPVLWAMPIFNDESIYLQYSQLIHEDFSKSKFISLQGVFGDWKPPLQYWLGSLVVAHGDPLISPRLLALAYSLLGLFGIYLLAKELFGRRTAAIAAGLWILSSSLVLYNVQFVAETFLFSTAPWLYWLVLKGAAGEKLRPLYILLALIPATALLLFKQSGIMLVLLALILPLTHLPRKTEKFRQRDESGRKERVEVESFDWVSFFWRFALVAGVILVAMAVERSILPAESYKVKANFDSNWLFSVKDLLGFPWFTWFSNLKMVGAYYLKYYSIFLSLLFIYGAISLVRLRSLKGIALILMFLGSSAALVFLFKGFNEYIYNTAAIVFIILIVAWGINAILAAPKNRWKTAGMILAGLLLINWAYQDVLMAVSPGRYFSRSTQWARVSYLEGLSSGFGVKEILDFINKQEEIVVVFADPQWGNPRTALEVYKRNSENPKVIVLPLSKDFRTAEGAIEIRDWARSDPDAKTLMVVYSSLSASGDRAIWQPHIQKYMCDRQTEIKGYPTQNPLIICEF